MTKVELTILFCITLVIIAIFGGAIYSSGIEQNEYDRVHRDRVICTSRITEQEQTFIVKNVYSTRYNRVCFENLDGSQTCILNQECTVTYNFQGNH